MKQTCKQSAQGYRRTGASTRMPESGQLKSGGSNPLNTLAVLCGILDGFIQTFSE
jgi:hypothetical protein